MRRGLSRISLVVLVVAGFGVCRPCAAATLSVAQPSNALDHGTLVVPIDFKAAPGENVSGLQFEIVFDAGQLTWQGLAAGPAAAAANKMVSSNGLSKGRYRVIIAGFNQTVVQDGAVATATFRTTGTAPAIRLENAILSDPAGKAVQFVAAQPETTPPNAETPARRPSCGCTGGISETSRDCSGDSATVLLTVLVLILAAYAKVPGA